MRLTTTTGSITVSFYSQDAGRRVTSTTGSAHGFVAPRTRYVKDATLPAGTTRVLQEAGESGFSVDYERRVYRGAQIRSNEHFHVTYQPEDRVIGVSGH